MRIKSLALAVASFALTACYHVTVTHNPGGVSQAAAGTVVDKPFSHSFIWGLVPPPELNVKDQCPNGVTKVETEQSFVNGLVGIITGGGLLVGGIYSPMHVKVSCR